MKPWQNLAAPDDPNSYYDIDGFCPTKRGSYETADFLSGTEYTATGAATPIYAFAAQTLNSGQREYVIDGSIWQYATGTLTDRTGGLTIQTAHMAQYGNVTLLAAGGYKGALPGRPSAYSTGGNFAALAGAPQADIVCVAQNIAWWFNLGTGANSGNGWASSDVGDYTNYATLEANSGTILSWPGDITAAVPFQDGCVIVFQEGAIHRFRWVGGQLRTATDLLFPGIGCVGRTAACAGRSGILFVGSMETSAYKTVNPSIHLFWWDGASWPVPVNELTAMAAATASGIQINYDPREDVFSISCPNTGSSLNMTYYFCPTSGLLSKHSTPIVSGQAAVGFPVMGDFYGRPDSEKSPQPVLWSKENANKLKRFSHGIPIGEIASACYVETQKIGTPERRTQFNRAVPLLRRRVDLGTDSATATLTLFRERADTTATTTRTSIAESSDRKRFDLMNGTSVDTYGRVKITWNALDVEVDDVVVDTKDVGAN